MSVAKYREHASELIFKSYLLFKRSLQDQGERVVFETILAFLNKEQTDPYLFESAIFVIRTLLDAFEKTTSPSNLSEFLRISIENIV